MLSAALRTHRWCHGLHPPWSLCMLDVFKVLRKPSVTQLSIKSGSRTWILPWKTWKTVQSPASTHSQQHQLPFLHRLGNWLASFFFFFFSHGPLIYAISVSLVTLFFPAPPLLQCSSHLHMAHAADLLVANLPINSGFWLLIARDHCSSLRTPEARAGAVAQCSLGFDLKLQLRQECQVLAVFCCGGIWNSLSSVAMFCFILKINIFSSRAETSLFVF